MRCDAMAMTAHPRGSLALHETRDNRKSAAMMPLLGMDYGSYQANDLPCLPPSCGAIPTWINERCFSPIIFDGRLAMMQGCAAVANHEISTQTLLTKVLGACATAAWSLIVSA